MGNTPTSHNLTLRIERRLRARMKACAAYEGISVPEFLRGAATARCTAVEDRAHVRGEQLPSMSEPEPKEET